MNAVPAVWNRTARSLHWIMAALLILQWASGEWDDWLGEPFHFSLGVIVLLLAVLRLIWRLTHAGPPLGRDKLLVDRLAGLVHFLFYVAMVAMPITGILWRQARERAVDVFGLFTLPQFVEPGRELARRMHDWHELGAQIFLVLFGMHVVGVLLHLRKSGDQTLRRMLG